MRHLAVALLLAGCSDAPEEPAPQVFVFSPEPALAEVTERWVGEWSAKTGISMMVGEGGVPVLRQEALVNDEGAELCAKIRKLFRGEEWIGTESILIDPTPHSGCPSQSFSVAHELAHALGASEHSVVDGVLFSDQTAPNVRYSVDADSVGAVCAQVACPALR